MLLRIVAPHFVAGLVLNVRAAPIIKYMLYWELNKIQQYCKHKKWTVEILDETQ